MIQVNPKLTPANLLRKITRLWELSAEKIQHIEQHYDAAKGSPVFTVKGKYTTRGWTEWTQVFSTARPFCSMTPPTTPLFWR